jgi:hypothetical protein
MAKNVGKPKRRITAESWLLWLTVADCYFADLSVKERALLV